MKMMEERKMEVEDKRIIIVLVAAVIGLSFILFTWIIMFGFSITASRHIIISTL
jgi:hypothetical protein